MKQREQLSLGRSRPSFLSAAPIFSFLFAFVCFIPNPSLPIGGSTGLQAGQIIALLSLPLVLMLGLPRKHVLALMLLLLPVLISSYLLVLTRQVLSPQVTLNTTIAMLLVFVVLVPVGWVVNKKHIVPMLSGIAWAIMLHLLVGLYQTYWFAQNKFPLLSLYQNPSFHSFVTKDPERYASYVQRPFGLFPEPSAMAASIGPWLVLFVGLLLYPRLQQGITRGTRMQLLLAAVAGIVLILISSSGFTIWLLASLLLVALPVLKNRLSQLYRPGSFLVLVTIVLVGTALVALSVTYMGARGLEESSSWSARLASIVWALAYLGTSPSTFIFGVGAGQATLILQSPGFSSLLPTSTGRAPVTAVWSVVVNYFLETGLLGALALTVILIMVLRAIVRSSARLVGLSCFMAWLAGVIVTTSYLPLLPIWFFFGVLVVWDRIFQVRADTKGLNSTRGVSPIPEGVKT